METEGIATSVLSFTSPGIWFGDIDQTKALARQCNEFLSRLAADHPGRFGGFAFLPLPDIDAALSETAYALDELKLDGITLLTSVDDKYIGHPYFEPLYAELNRRRAVVFIHPLLSTRHRGRWMGHPADADPIIRSRPRVLPIKT